MDETSLEQAIAVAARLLGEVPRRIENIHSSARRGVFRAGTAGAGRILKWSPGDFHEKEAYRLLGRLRVPTLQVFAASVDALLLEDLGSSADWRLSTLGDVLRPEIGKAVAEWYLQLHAAGLRLTARERPAFLRRETDAITNSNIERAARRLGLEDLRVWRIVSEHLDALKARYEALPTTLLYNDFHWSNLALARSGPERAIVFDYHLLGIGPTVSDYRNVLTSLGPAAGAAFRERYGGMDEAALALDAALATLCALAEATRRDTLPRWGERVVEQVRSGELEDMVRQLT